MVKYFWCCLIMTKEHDEEFVPLNQIEEIPNDINIDNAFKKTKKKYMEQKKYVSELEALIYRIEFDYFDETLLIGENEKNEELKTLWVKYSEMDIDACKLAFIKKYNSI